VLFSLARLPGGAAVVAGAGGACRRAIAVAELDRALPVTDTVEEARERLRGSG
jgi:hypothetical protein